MAFLDEEGADLRGDGAATIRSLHRREELNRRDPISRVVMDPSLHDFVAEEVLYAGGGFLSPAPKGNLRLPATAPWSRPARASGGHHVGQVALCGLEGQTHKVGADLLELVGGESRVAAVVDELDEDLGGVWIDVHRGGSIPASEGRRSAETAQLHRDGQGRDPDGLGVDGQHVAVQFGEGGKGWVSGLLNEDVTGVHHGGDDDLALDSLGEMKLLHGASWRCDRRRHDGIEVEVRESTRRKAAANHAETGVDLIPRPFNRAEFVVILEAMLSDEDPGPSLRREILDHNSFLSNDGTHDVLGNLELVALRGGGMLMGIGIGIGRGGGVLVGRVSQVRRRRHSHTPTRSTSSRTSATAVQ